MHLRILRFTAFLLIGAPVFATSIPGIRNFDQVDTNVYRGGQPTAEGFRYLAGLGVKTVIDLRESGARSDAERTMVKNAGMNYLNVPMSGLTPPTPAEITRILDLLEHPSTGPAFVHCLHGADRTGAVIAAYHIDHDHWDNARALRDAKAHSMSVFQLPRENFIRQFQARDTSLANGLASRDRKAPPAAAIVPALP